MGRCLVWMSVLGLVVEWLSWVFGLCVVVGHLGLLFVPNVLVRCFGWMFQFGI